MGKPGVGGPGGGAWFKKFNHQLTAAECKPNGYITCIWIYKDDARFKAAQIPDQAGPNWTRIADMDIAGEGDVK